MTKSIENRWENYRPSKTLWFWSCVACVTCTMIVGFSWGGWVTGGTAEKLAGASADTARAELVAAFCVDRFVNADNATAQLASLKKTDEYERNDFIKKGGWVTLPGTAEPVSGAATLCAEKLITAKLPVAKAAVSPKG